MTRRVQIVHGLGLLLLVAGVVAGGYWWAAPLLPERPAFSLEDLQGASRPIGEFDGDVVVLNFWASWCGPCRKEIPMLVRAQTQWGMQGLQIVGVAIDTREAAAEFARRYGINYPVLADATQGARVQDMYTQQGTPAGVLPYTAIIDRRGRIVARIAGALSHDQLARQIEPLLAEPAATASE